MKQMRVISGRARGTKLIAPKGLETRPTSDKIKESLFNIISFELNDSTVLDLFSGSGALGIETLSRGAKQAVFVDVSKEACKVIKQNLDKTKFADKAIIFNMSIGQALNQLGKEQRQFDWIFMDPPYNKNMIGDTIQLIIQNNLLSTRGNIVIERSPSENVPNYTGLEIWKEKKYGVTIMSFLRSDIQ